MNLKKPGWMSDHRLISDDAMEVIRHIAVAAIVDRNKRPDDVILYVFNICDFSIIWNFSEKRVRSDSRLSD